MNLVTKIIDKTIEPITDDLGGWEKVDGNPAMTTWIEYTSPDESMITGCWSATPGTYRATYASWEFIHLIEGEVIITQDGQVPVTLNPGDAFIIEAGFTGTWEIIKPVFKHFAIKLK